MLGPCAYVGMTPEQKVDFYKRRIVEYEKFSGPIAQKMIEHCKKAIDAIRSGQHVSQPQQF